MEKTNVCNGKAIMPNFDRVITKELKKEEYYKYFPQKNSKGVMRPKGSYKDEINEYEEAVSLTGIAEVIAIGPNVRDIKVGDHVMYDLRAAFPLPIKFDWDIDDIPLIRTFSEQNVKCVMKSV